MTEIYLGSTEFVDVDGNLVRVDDWFNTRTGMPRSQTTILERAGSTRGRRAPPRRVEEVDRRVVRSWTGADIEVIKWRDQYGTVHTDEKVVRLNTGDDDDCAPDGRFG